MGTVTVQIKTEDGKILGQGTIEVPMMVEKKDLPQFEGPVFLTERESALAAILREVVGMKSPTTRWDDDFQQGIDSVAAQVRVHLEAIGLRLEEPKKSEV